MNAERRLELAIIIRSLRNLCDEEENAYDALSESAQNSDRGESMQNTISSIDTAIDHLESIE